MVPDEAIRPVRQEIRLLFDLCEMDYIKPEHLAETFAAARRLLRCDRAGAGQRGFNMAFSGQKNGGEGGK